MRKELSVLIAILCQVGRPEREMEPQGEGDGGWSAKSGVALAKFFWKGKKKNPQWTGKTP